MNSSRDAYDVLGVAPTSEEVVIRAAYRALMRRYLAAEHGDPRPEDRRAREVSAAYELLSDPRRRRAYDTARRTAPAAAQRPARAALPGADRRLAIAGAALALGLVAAIGLAAALRPAPGRVAAPWHPGLKVQKLAAKRAVGALPCYVQGRPVGDLPLMACAARNGVATGPLVVGLEPAAAAPPPRSPAAGPTRLPASPPAPEGSPPARALNEQTPPAGPPPARFASWPSVSSAARSMAVARAFYGALGGGDGYRAAGMIEPEKRGYGPLSGTRMSRFYRSLAEPLRLTSLYALSPDTVFVRYRFATSGGGVCQGAANVITSQRGGQTFIRAIRAYNGC
jgi:hypothetical protein